MPSQLEETRDDGIEEASIPNSKFYIYIDIQTSMWFFKSQVNLDDADRFQMPSYSLRFDWSLLELYHFSRVDIHQLRDRLQQNCILCTTGYSPWGFTFHTRKNHCPAKKSLSYNLRYKSTFTKFKVTLQIWQDTTSGWIQPGYLQRGTMNL